MNSSTSLIKMMSSNWSLILKRQCSIENNQKHKIYYKRQMNTQSNLTFQTETNQTLLLQPGHGLEDEHSTEHHRVDTMIQMQILLDECSHLLS